MAELDIVAAWTCDTNRNWHRQVPGGKPGVVYDVRFEYRPTGFTQYDYTCTCKAFAFGKGEYCKHIRQVMDERCGWNEEMEPTEKALAKDGERVCPHCEGPVVATRVGV